MNADQAGALLSCSMGHWWIFSGILSYVFHICGSPSLQVCWSEVSSGVLKRGALIFTIAQKGRYHFFSIFSLNLSNEDIPKKYLQYSLTLLSFPLFAHQEWSEKKSETTLTILQAKMDLLLQGPSQAAIFITKKPIWIFQFLIEQRYHH